MQLQQTGAVAPPRALGALDVTLFMITAGCSLQWTATAAAAGPSSLLIWLLGALGFFLPLSLSVVYLTSRYPEAGGLYGWARLAFGPYAGFMSGWTYWTGTLAFLPSVLYFTAGSALLSSVRMNAASATPSWFIGFSVTALILAAVLNVRGLTVAKWLNSVGAVARWIGTGLLIALAIACWSRFGPATEINRHTIVPSFRLTDVIFWTTLAFCFTGPEAASFMGNEIRDPRHSIPRGLMLAAPMIAGIYIIGTASILLSIPAERASGVYGVIESVRGAAGRLGLWWLVPIGAACVVLDRIGSVCLWIGALARIPVSAGIDTYLPARFTRIDARNGAPTTAIWVQALIVAALVLIGQSGTSIRGAYNVLIEMMVVASLVPFLTLFGATIKLSALPPQAGEVRSVGRRVLIVGTAVLGLATTAASIVVAFIPPPEEVNPALAVLKIAGLNTLFLLGGSALFLYGNARARRSMSAGAATNTI